jgi:hypothetical protein
MTAKKQGKNKTCAGKYLEIYIEKDGKAILTPLTNRTLNAFQVIVGKKKTEQSLFCG